MISRYIILLITILTPFEGNTIKTFNKEHQPEELSLYHLLIEKEIKDSIYTQELIKYQDQDISTTKHVPSEKNSPLYRKYLNIKHTSHHTQDLLSKKISSFLNLSEEAKKEKCIFTEFQSKTDAFLLAFWEKPANYYKAFSIAISLEKRLSEINEEEFPEIKMIYLKLGEAYYLFKDYRKSILLLRKVLNDNIVPSFGDTTDMEARKIIGICYANINQMDSSDYYFKSTLLSKNVVLNRPMYNAIAISHLACNYMLKKEYDTSLPLFHAVLPFIKTGTDYGHIAGMYYAMGNSYYQKKEYHKISNIIDSIFVFAKKDEYNRTKRIKQAYTLANKYYTVTGDFANAEACNDSLLYYYSTDETLYTSSYISQALQDSKNKEIEEQFEKINYQQTGLIIYLSVIILCLIVIALIAHLYIRKQIAYRILVNKTEEWAFSESHPILSSIRYQRHKATIEDKDIMEKVIQYVVVNRNFSNPDLTLNLLSCELSINRTYLSKAINVITNKGFSEWLNEYRIKEAIKLLSMVDQKRICIDNIAFETGYNNRTTFYRSFKKITGLSPTTYLNNRGKKKYD